MCPGCTFRLDGSSYGLPETRLPARKLRQYQQDLVLPVLLADDCGKEDDENDGDGDGEDYYCNVDLSRC